MNRQQFRALPAMLRRMIVLRALRARHKYMPHQGPRECARRVRQMIRDGELPQLDLQ